MNLSPILKQRFFDANGAPLNAGLLYSYIAGSSTPLGTYSNQGGTTNTNPVVLGTDGYADVWIDPTKSYKFVLEDSSNNVLWTVDNVNVVNSQNANLVYAGPATGSPALPGFRAGVSQDIALAILSKTANYSALVSDDVILCSGSAFTVTLPAASTVKQLVIKKTDSSFANIITIARAGSDTIDGATSTTLNTQYEAVTLVSDGGTSWSVMNRTYPETWASYTPAITGSSSNPTKGTTSLDSASWRRTGSSIEIIYAYVQTVAGSAGSGYYKFSIPSGLTIDTTACLNTYASGGNGQLSGLNIGNASFYDGSTVNNGWMMVTDSTTLSMVSVTSANIIGQGSAVCALNNTVVRYGFRVIVPISGWK